jgi:hypothetical protein
MGADIDRLTAHLRRGHESYSKAAHPAALYRMLSVEEGHQVARWALGRLGTAETEEWELGEKVLLHLSCLVPGSLDGLHADLARRGAFEYPIIYREADATARDEMLSLLTLTDDPAAIRALLCALAWVGDLAVRARFAEWWSTPPPWLLVEGFWTPTNLLAAAAEEAGWRIGTRPDRGDLYLPTAHRLVRSGADGAIAGPVSIAVPVDGTCRWCQRRLITLFDLDLRDPSLAFLGLAGERLRIVTCEMCTTYSDAYYMAALPDGSWAWDEHNARLAIYDDPRFARHAGDEWTGLPERCLALGPRRPTPVTCYQWLDEWENPSQLGGYPMWVQDPAYPGCPTCGEQMPMIGQVAMGDVLELGEGITYAFYCAPCGVAATTYQQT